MLNALQSEISKIKAEPNATLDKMLMVASESGKTSSNVLFCKRDMEK